MIRKVKKEDLDELAIIYKSLYDDANIGETWSFDSAKKLLTYWFEKQQDLFFVYEDDKKACGAVVSGAKPWFDGNRLIDTEIFVSNEYQGNHIAKKLLKAHLEEAKFKF